MDDSPGKRLASFRKSLGMSQRAFATQVGVSQTRVGSMETDAAPLSRAFLEKISEAYGVSADWLLNGHGEMLRAPGAGFTSRKVKIDPSEPSQPNHGELSVGGKDYAWVKRMGLSVSAGSGIEELPEDESEGVFFPMRWFERRGINADLCVLVSVRGDSMSPSIPDGALVMINCQDKLIGKPGIYAFSRNGQSYVKRVIPSGQDKLGRPQAIMLTSDNPAFPPVVLTGSEMNDLRLAGRVVAILNLLKD